MRNRMVATAVAVSLVIGACDGRTVTGDADEMTTTLRAVHYEFTAHESPKALLDEAALTAVGRVVGVTDGRAFTMPGDADSERTAHLHIAVDQVLGGKAETDTIRVEIPLDTRHSIEGVGEAAVGLRMLVFLSDYTVINDTRTIAYPDDLTKHDTVYAPYADGVIIEDEDGGLLGGFVDLAELGPGWTGFDTVENLVGTLGVKADENGSTDSTIPQ